MVYMCVRNRASLKMAAACRIYRRATVLVCALLVIPVKEVYLRSDFDDVKTVQ